MQPPSQPLLTDKEKLILRLALDAGVQPGEMAVAASKLIESWRQRGLHVEDFVPPPPEQPPQKIIVREGGRKNSKPDYGLCVWPWPRGKDGPHKNKKFKEIPPQYLHNQLKWIRSDPSRSQQFCELAHQIEQFLAQ